MQDNDETNLQRREALARLAKLSVYTAPTVVSLLVISETSAAVGSCSTMTNLSMDRMGGMPVIPGDGSMNVAASDFVMTDGNFNLGGTGLSDTAMDCG